MPHTIRERSQKVMQALRQGGTQTLRALAQALGMSKSSVHRHQQAMQRRQQHPESALWESPAGAAWLKLLVLATVFVFCCQRGVGCETVSAYFKLLRLDRHIGVSVSSVRQLKTQIETNILIYQKQQNQQYRERQVAPLDICAAVDETFFEQVILVLMDLASGFIVLETVTTDSRYETWETHASQALAQLGLQVRYCVSDRAKALIKLAEQAWGCPSLPDLFHALRGLSQGMGQALTRQLKQLQRRLPKVAQMPDQAELLAQLEAQATQLQTAQQDYQQCLHQITTTLHPFNITSGQAQTTPQVLTQLQHHTHTLQQIQQTTQLPDPSASLDQWQKLLPDLVAGVDLWWLWVRQELNTRTTDAALMTWILHTLLPAQYWSNQTRRTAQPTLKTRYQLAAAHALTALQHHPLTTTLTAAQLADWAAWADLRVAQCQRASSAVEGRNGFLSAIHHNQRGFSQQRLQALTTIHNFYLKRPDGTTAAERLFRTPPPDLFDWLVQQMPDLPVPRQRKSTTKSKTPVLPAVPA
jgi:Family of unknown function (DUF6399)/IclR helix-turn-helix domain